MNYQHTRETDAAETAEMGRGGGVPGNIPFNLFLVLMLYLMKSQINNRENKEVIL